MISIGLVLSCECVCVFSPSCGLAAQLRKDLYDPNIRKFLVLVRDDVESAEEKLQELQQEMAQMGLLNSDFELGDIMEELEGDSNSEQGKPVPGKKRLAEYPAVEGEETIQEYLGQYRRAILSRKALLKGARERLEKEGAKGHELLACAVYALCNYVYPLIGTCTRSYKRPFIILEMLDGAGTTSRPCRKVVVPC